MDEKVSPAEHFLEIVASALAARRAPIYERVRRIEIALDGYRRAVDAQLTREFAREHAFKQPAAPVTTPERAAELLLAAVQALPEIREMHVVRASAVDESEPAPAATITVPVAGSAGFAYPRLLARVARGKIVVIGALSGRDRHSALPPDLSEQVEWIDTERDGAHAVGNLPQRVRQGRVAAIVILDRAVQHRHTDPVMAAARDSAVPFAFAGQGGKASLVRALEQLEVALAQSSAERV